MKKKTRTKKKPIYICYTGYDEQKKSPNHTQEEFMKIMNRKSKIARKNKYLHKKLCAEYFASKKCKPCLKHKRNLRYRIRKSRKNPKYVTSEKQKKKQDKLFLKCSKCKEKSKKACNLEDFIKYSGAVKGKCKFENNSSTMKIN